MRYIILFVLLTVACGKDICKGSDMETAQGICVFTNGYDIDIDKVSAAVTGTEDVLLSKQFPHYSSRETLQKGYPDTSISFVKAVRGNGEDGHIMYSHYPLERKTYEIEVESSPCSEYNDILPHELIHLYLISIDGDETHRDGWFIFSDNHDVVKGSIQQEIISYLGPALCGWEQ